MTEEVMKTVTPEDGYSFDAWELVDSVNELSKLSDEPCVTVWVRRENGMIDRIVKASIEKAEDGEMSIYLDVL